MTALYRYAARGRSPGSVVSCSRRSARPTMRFEKGGRRNLVRNAGAGTVLSGGSG